MRVPNEKREMRMHRESMMKKERSTTHNAWVGCSLPAVCPAPGYWNGGGTSISRHCRSCLFTRARAASGPRLSSSSVLYMHRTGLIGLTEHSSHLPGRLCSLDDEDIANGLYGNVLCDTSQYANSDLYRVYYLDDMKDPVSFCLDLKPVGSPCLQSSTSRKDFLHKTCESAIESLRDTCLFALFIEL